MQKISRYGGDKWDYAATIGSYLPIMTSQLKSIQAIIPNVVMILHVKYNTSSRKKWCGRWGAQSLERQIAGSHVVEPTPVKMTFSVTSGSRVTDLYVSSLLILRYSFSLHTFAVWETVVLEFCLSVLIHKIFFIIIYAFSSLDHNFFLCVIKTKGFIYLRQMSS